MRGRISIAIWLLAAGQTCVWAALYYSFAALLPSWTADFGWSERDAALGLTLALFASAALAPTAGRLIDAGRGPALLCGGGALGAVLVAALAAVESRGAFLALWAAVGAAQAACLYEPCFAFVTRRLGADARRAITRITLVAGFASSLAFPTGVYLSASLGWRGAVLAFAAIGLLGALLLGAGARSLRAATEGPASRETRDADRTAARAALAQPAFWLLALSFAMMALNHGALINLLMPLLVGQGLGAGFAVLAASLVGPMQVVGRVALIAFGAAKGAATLSGVAFLAVAAAALALLGAGAGAPWLVFVFVALQGGGYGVTSILRPAATAELLGRAGFGAISGRMATPFLFAAAVAPFGGAAVLEAAGGEGLIAAAAATALIGAVGVAAARRIPPR